MLIVKVKKSLPGFSINADFHLQHSGVTVLFGQSGAGKTTLLKLITGTVTPDTGTISCKGVTFFDSSRAIALPPEKRGIACVFQQHRLFSHLSVENNLLFSVHYCNRPFDQHFYQRVLELLGITHLLKRRTSALSGGESQRVAIGRALLSKSSLLLMDEPLSSLDQPRKYELIGYISDIAHNLHIPIIYITHSIEELKLLADHVLSIHNGRTHCLLPLQEFINFQH